MACLVIFFFILVMQRRSAFFIGTATLWRTLRTLLTHSWDHWNFFSDQCYKNTLTTVKMSLAG